MIQASAQPTEAAIHEGALTQNVRRIGAGTFWSLIGLELLVIFGALIWVFGWFPPMQTPYASTRDIATVQEAIYARLSGTTIDPLVQVQPGVSARASNLRGFALSGETYYYYVVGANNFDPYSLGRVNEAQIEVLLQDESGSQPLVIYIIK
jgi:hypothetical protein